MQRLRHDLLFAARRLVRDRGFASACILTLAVCVGAATGAFAVLRSVVLKPLPYPDPDRILFLHNSYPHAGVERASTAVPDYYDRLREVDSFEALALFSTRGQTIGVEGRPERVTGLAVTPSFFSVLRARPYRGRLFTEGEGELGAHHKVVLSFTLWQRLYAAADSAIGRELRINGIPHTIVGVMPRGFDSLSSDIRLWTPAAFSPEEKSDAMRHSNNWTMIGRLRRDATREQAKAQVDALNAANLERFPHLREALVNAGFHTRVTGLHAELVRDVDGALDLLFGGALFVLLLGSVNLASLMLGRSAARLKEYATRHALGAGRLRLASQTVAETVLLTTAGGVLGLLLAWEGLTLLGTQLEQIPRGAGTRLDAVVLGFCVLLVLITTAILGAASMAGLGDRALNQAFRAEGRASTSGRTLRTIRRTLVTGQVAIALVLLAAAGLLLASFRQALAVKPGFDPEGVLTGTVGLPASRYAEDEAVVAFLDRALGEIRSLPGVTTAGATTTVPFGESFSDSVILAEGYRMAPGESLISPNQLVVSPGYFETMRIPLIRGRLFSASDVETAPPVVIVDERLARKFWPGNDPIGRRMYQPGGADDLFHTGPDTRWLTVVGVVGDVRLQGVTDADTRFGAYYFPYAQSPRSRVTFAIRTAGSGPAALGGQVRERIFSIDPELPLFDVKTMNERIDRSLAGRQTALLLSIWFGGVALLLAGIGLYGVLAFQVTQRRREIAVRFALGATSENVFTMVVREGLALSVIGAVLGLAGALVLRRAIESQLYGVRPFDPVVLATVGAMLGSVALAATLLPARRAARVNPAVTLAEE